MEFPTTRLVGASARQRAADVNTAFADPDVRAVLATIGGEDQITVVPHLDAATIASDPKPFLGYSDNTNLLNWLWTNGVAGFYGGSTQVHLGPGPHVDREPTEPWTWAGPARAVTGRTWGGCIEVVHMILTAGRFPTDPSILDGGVLLLEASEDLTPAREFGWITRSLGERGILEAVDAVVVARPPTSDLVVCPPAQQRRAKRDAQRDTVIDVVHAYNPDAVIVVGPPFGHTRPQWIVPYGGPMTVDGANRRLSADYR